MPTKSAPEKKIEEEIPKKKNSLKLPIAFFVCFLISVGASSGIAYFFLLPDLDNSNLAKKLTEQTTLTATMETSLLAQNDKISAIEEQNNTLKLYLRHSSATAIKNILIDQERNIQAYLKVMKSSMEDLSDIVPRATDWNNEYQYQLDLALKGSMQREDLLTILKTGEPNDKASP
ncbi:hypothetical protein [Marinomonas sp. IMCC 4694]|uniref:hypothetical protein n=1 Tax=Marinomonas sp. IMCC 4694 TaxID=2605432 RepID=UPI0011E72423|nr:hypothetical protein [Marinomonas sp. IMCC 4694]TYL47291.1 hypothetical protein FXV75_04610 [Marinomonas sp. IMCC 4694]